MNSYVICSKKWKKKYVLPSHLYNKLIFLLIVSKNTQQLAFEGKEQSAFASPKPYLPPKFCPDVLCPQKGR